MLKLHVAMIFCTLMPWPWLWCLARSISCFPRIFPEKCGWSEKPLLQWISSLVTEILHQVVQDSLQWLDRGGWGPFRKINAVLNGNLQHLGGEWRPLEISHEDPQQKNSSLCGRWIISLQKQGKNLRFSIFFIFFQSQRRMQVVGPWWMMRSIA